MQNFLFVGVPSAGTSWRVARSTTPGAVYKSDSGVIIHAEGTVVLELYQCSWAWAERKGCFGLIDSKV